MKSSYVNYYQLQKIFDEAEKNENYRKLLSASLEIIPFIASKKASDLDKEKIEKVYEYTCNYLSVLQEEDELKNIKRLSSRLPYSEKIIKESESALEKIDIVKEIYEYINQNPKITRQDIYEHFDVPQNTIDEILNYSLQIGKVNKTDTENLKINKSLSCKEIFTNYVFKKSSGENIIKRGLKRIKNLF